MTDQQPAAMPEASAETSIFAELSAMDTAYQVLSKLDCPAQDRALYWLNQRLRWARPQDEVPF